jgi:hypothetical protein
VSAPNRPKPIRYDVDTWLCMRNDPEHPKAVIERRRDGRGDDVFLVSRWHISPSSRTLMGTAPTLERADLMVRWDLPQKRDGRDGPPNGIDGDGVQRRR